MTIYVLRGSTLCYCGCGSAATQAPNRALTGNSAFWNGNEAECITGSHLRDSHVERPSGCKNVTLLIINEATGKRVSAGAKVENCICVTYPRASPMQPISNCCFKQGKWSWHDKLRQNKSVGWGSVNLWDTEIGIWCQEELTLNEYHFPGSNLQMMYFTA